VPTLPYTIATIAIKGEIVMNEIEEKL